MNISVLLTVLVLLLLVTSVVAIALAVVALKRSQPGHARRASAMKGAASLPTDVDGLRAEVQALRVEVAEALRHLAVVRYDAFGDMGGHLSWSMALLDDGGNGVVLTSIHGRSEARTYAKNVAAWSCDQALSPEEEEAIKFAKAS
ncbi:DUF4446 family protein [Nocardioides sp. WL0053]|jgi:uncharacterized protein DUF4446|uniref:DUF4446 family protein n=1 Tax=Nocardioides jiangsuensis TaxID=2866161 RepID=A0ABS7RJQ5_9ACTN|nr:DUF4446 family protein [Nocardioides jiangsuensis]MBY9074303.1 DUF4446 family protein [Nocardioides jiangsuensis]